MKARCGEELCWHNCYSGVYDLITPDSVAHPAKMAPTLCFRILQHLKELGLLKDGEYLTITPEVLDNMSKEVEWCDCDNEAQTL